MRQIIKQTCPSRQLFEKITFAFMKIFDLLVKIAIFWVGSSLSWVIPITRYFQKRPQVRKVMRDGNLLK